MKPNAGSQVVRIPSARAMIEVGQARGLDAEKSRHLSQAVDHIARSIQEHATLQERKGRSRREQVAHVRRLVKLLSKLRNELVECDIATDKFFGKLIGVYLGKLLSHAAVERLTGLSLKHEPSVHF